MTWQSASLGSSVWASAPGTSAGHAQAATTDTRRSIDRAWEEAWLMGIRSGNRFRIIGASCDVAAVQCSIAAAGFAIVAADLEGEPE